MSSVRIICKRKKKKLKRLLKLSYVKLINLTVFLSLESPVRHLHISHNAPHSPPKNLHNFVFHFSWVLQPSQGTLKTMLKYNLGGGGGANKVHYGRCASGQYNQERFSLFLINGR